MIDIEKSVCFTGHRPQKLGGYDETSPAITNIKKALLSEIVDAYNKGYRTFISGMALGVDIWAAELVIGLRNIFFEDIELIAAIPFEGQEKAWPAKAVFRWKKIKKLADQVVIVSEGGYAAWKMQKRNSWMVDNSSLVIAVYDGSGGGTGNCVKYAGGKKKEIIQINPKELNG